MKLNDVEAEVKCQLLTV